MGFELKLLSFELMSYLSALLGPAGPAGTDEGGSPPEIADSEGLHWTVFLLLDVEGGGVEVGGGEVGGVGVVFLLASGILHIVDNFRTPVTVGSQPLHLKILLSSSIRPRWNCVHLIWPHWLHLCSLASRQWWQTTADGEDGAAAGGAAAGTGDGGPAGCVGAGSLVGLSSRAAWISLGLRLPKRFLLVG